MIRNSILLLAVAVVMMSPTAAIAEPFSETAEPLETLESSDAAQQGFQTLKNSDIADVLKDSSDDISNAEVISRPPNEPKGNPRYDPRDDSSGDEGHSHIFLIIGMVLNFLLTAMCFLVFKDRLNKIAASLRSEAKKTPKNTARHADTQSSDRDEELQALWSEVRGLKSEVRDLEFKFEKRLDDHDADLNKSRSEESEWKAASKKLSDAPANQLPSLYKPTNSSQPSPSTQNTDLKTITDDYKNMVVELSKASAWNSKSIKNKFFQKYNVVAFKCVNHSERVNRPDEPPVFKKSDLPENDFWGVPVPNGALIVFPNPGPLDYESSRHNQGGFKELFDVKNSSGVKYSSGSYKKIHVESPAIVTRDFKLIQQGRLRLEM